MVYDTPKYPTLEESQSNSKLLRKLPSRWKKNAAVIACAGMLALGMLTACSTPEPPIPLIWDAVYDDLQVGMHFGGRGGAPTYLVHLTENEAKAILLARMEQFGLKFSSNIPESAPSLDFGGYIFNLDLHNSYHNVGFLFLSRNSEIGWPVLMTGATDSVRYSFERITDMPIGVFYNGTLRLTIPNIYTQRPNTPQEFTQEEKEQHREELRRRMVEQADDFIAELRTRGIVRG